MNHRTIARPINKRVLLVCSPNIGILENWLPIICELKNEYGFRFSVVFPAPRIMNGLVDNPVLKEISVRVFDEVIYSDNKLIWKRGPIGEVERNYYKTRLSGASVRFINRNIERLIDRTSFRILGVVLNYFSRWNLRSTISKSNSGKSLAVLYDVYEERKKYNAEVTRYFASLPKFSLPHGFSLPANNHKFNPTWLVGFEKRGDDRDDLVAFRFSLEGNGHFKEQYKVKSENVHGVGVPRHQKKWVQEILKTCSQQSWFCDRPFVLLISRPSNKSFYLTEKRKKQYLEEIKELVIDALGISVVVKKHPGEVSDEVFAEVFGKRNRGTTWEISSLHPYIISCQALFAITFYSGLSIDFAALKIPSIERVDLSGLESHDNTSALRRLDGLPVSPFSYYGLTLNAATRIEFEQAISSCLVSPEATLKHAYDQYRRLFFSADRSAEKVASIIVSNIFYDCNCCCK